MAEPGFTEEDTTNEGPDPQDLLRQQQEIEIQTARDAGLTDLVHMLELLRDNDDKDLYRDAATGSKVTVLDGDSEAIVPYLENSHARALEHFGGVEGLIADRQSQFDDLIAQGTMNQALADRMIELLEEAGTDSAAYAQARFDNNDFFAEQAVLLGRDPEKANDITVTVTRTVEIGPAIENAPEPSVIEQDFRPEAVENSDTMIKVAEGNELTQAGQLLLVGDAMADLGVMDPLNMIKQNFDQMIQEHGSAEALAVHLEENMEDLIGDSNLTEEGRAAVIDAVRNSEGDSAKFVATMFNQAEELSAGAEASDPSAALLNQQQEATLAQERAEEGAAALRREEAMREGAPVEPVDPGELSNFSTFMGEIAFTGEALDADRLIELGADPRRVEILRQFGVIKADSGTDSAPTNEEEVTPPDTEVAGADAEVSEDVQVAANEGETATPPVTNIEADTIDVSHVTGADTDLNADVTVEEPDVIIDADVEEPVEVSAVEMDADKGYVSNPNGGPVTYEVSGVETGEPIRSDNGDLYAFADGSGLSDGFSSASDPDPTQVAMVDPFQDAMAALEKIGYTNDSNNMAFGTMSA